MSKDAANAKEDDPHTVALALRRQGVTMISYHNATICVKCTFPIAQNNDEGRRIAVLAQRGELCHSHCLSGYLKDLRREARCRLMLDGFAHDDPLRQTLRDFFSTTYNEPNTMHEYLFVYMRAIPFSYGIELAAQSEVQRETRWNKKLNTTVDDFAVPTSLIDPRRFGVGLWSDGFVAIEVSAANHPKPHAVFTTTRDLTISMMQVFADSHQPPVSNAAAAATVSPQPITSRKHVIIHDDAVLYSVRIVTVADARVFLFVRARWLFVGAVDTYVPHNIRATGNEIEQPWNDQMKELATKIIAELKDGSEQKLHGSGASGLKFSVAAVRTRVQLYKPGICVNAQAALRGGAPLFHITSSTGSDSPGDMPKLYFTPEAAIKADGVRAIYISKPTDAMLVCADVDVSTPSASAKKN